MLNDDERRRVARQAASAVRSSWPAANSALTLAVAQEMAAKIADGFDVGRPDVVELARQTQAIAEAELRGPSHEPGREGLPDDRNRTEPGRDRDGPGIGD